MIWRKRLTSEVGGSEFHTNKIMDALSKTQRKVNLIVNNIITLIANYCDEIENTALMTEEEDDYNL